MAKKALIVSFSFEQEPEAFEALRERGVEPILLAESERKGWGQQELIDYWNALPEKPEGILMGADIEIGAPFTEQCEGLRYISLNCAGCDHLDLPALERAGIVACNVPRQNFDAVADFAWGQILSLMRRIPQGDQNIRAGRWCEGVARGCAVSRKTLGILGLGAIGQGVMRRAQGFEMDVLAYDPYENAELVEKYGVRYLPLQEVLTQSDIVVITCPLTDETHHLMNEKSLRSMKPQAFLVNCSRGPIVDTKALAKILREGKIAGAALDVYEEEPLLESELFSLPNTVLTPHMAGLADREIHNVAMQSAYNMADLLEGKEVKSRLI
ncbi:2-hydroxyacid dehydrogenase [Provencibacterium massiliense]|uniref:2-hydroxyacid dehydrogenase n=1 Tax=Provencibacterium massiliense TaxID=1841868 RepID=UPI00117B832E|nr:2-hydroxyacid dehydrogenase [Provencibacterium massiliense]